VPAAARSLTRRPASNAGRAGPIVWILAILVIAVVYGPSKPPVTAAAVIGGLVGLVILLAAVRRPDRALLTIIAVLPFQGFLLAYLWRIGIPTSIVRHLAAWKEALALGVVIAGFLAYVREGRRADGLDRIALGFVLLAAVYLAAQHLIVPSAPTSSSVRLLGFREDAGFVLLLLGARHAGLGTGFLDRASRWVVAAGMLVGGVAVFEAIDSGGWNHFVVNTVQYPHYVYGVLHSTLPNPYDIRVYGTIGGQRIVRSGSLFLNTTTAGFYLVLPFAIGLERLARAQARRLSRAAPVIIGAGLVLTQTRSAILAALVVALVTFRPNRGHRQGRRIQLAIAVAGLLLLAIPLAVSSGLTHRVSAATRGTDTSTSGHVAGFWDGARAIEHHPLGEGLGTSAGTGQRFQNQVSGVVVPENNYLQIGVELGVLGMLVFVALTVRVLVTLRHVERARPAAATAAAYGAIIGLAVGAWFLQVWIDFSVAWTVWGMAGAAIGASTAV
jgi:hypothetical protein